MSRRTSKASKAIRDKWLKEQELVAEGKGTRDWTPEQQKEILELGKAYYHSENPDDVNDGKAFEGHHMKSVEAYPEYQGDPENIQFLSRPEHQEAHGGDYKNPTNGYFNPVTKITKNFGNNKYEACEVIKLTNPIESLSDAVQMPSKTAETAPKNAMGKGSGEDIRKDNSSSKKINVSAPATAKPFLKPRKSFGKRIIDAVEVVKEFYEKHPVLVEEVVVPAVFIIGGAAIKGLGVRSKSSSLNNFNSNLSDNRSSLDDDVLRRLGREYPGGRSSPDRHTVSAHSQRYHTKNGIVLKDKKPYRRGREQ